MTWRMEEADRNFSQLLVQLWREHGYILQGECGQVDVLVVVGMKGRFSVTEAKV